MDTSNMDASRQLLHTTIRIEAKTQDGTCMGTGFFLDLSDKDGYQLPVIVTNRHVIKNAVEGHLVFSVIDTSGKLLREKYLCQIVGGFQNSWVLHPNSDVDLCALPMAVIVTDYEKRNPGKHLFYKTLSLSMLPKKEDIENLSAIEEIIMIGYPNGLWDEVNNAPIVRKGLTATSLEYDYCGRSEFLIDAACYPGSSGSPVLIFNDGVFTQKKSAVFGTRVLLLGVMYAGPIIGMNGDIVKIIPERIEAEPNLKSISQGYLNLGFVIKSEQLRVFQSILQKRIEQGS